MKTREEIKERADHLRGTFAGVSGATNMLYLVLEVLLDIREAVLNLPMEKE
jgi:hypothetical protein